MGETLWKLENVFLGGPGHPRLHDVSLLITKGSTAVVGPSGAGKTSLLNILVGFEKSDRGDANFSPSKNCRLPLYWVPQSGGLWPRYTVREHLEIVLPDPAKRGEISGLLESFDLADKTGSLPHQLSQGEQARLSAARAIMSGADVLVMDEPFVNVDLERRDRCWEAVREKLAETGASLIFSTHSPETALGEAERAVCLDEGRIVYEGRMEDLYRRPPNEDLARFLGEANWLSQEEARLWLGEEASGPVCYRPEQISITPDDGGPAIVKNWRFKGSVAEADLVHEESGETRRFFHRPSARLKAGGRAALKLLPFLLLLLLLTGCDDSGAPELAVKGVRLRSLPPDGRRLPAPRSLAVGENDKTAVLDTAGRVLVYSADGRLERKWKMPETEAGNPEGALFLKDGRLAVCDTHYHRVMFFNDKGEVVGEIGKEGRGEGEFIYPVALAQDDKGNIYIAEYGSNDRIQKFTAGGVFVKALGSFGTGTGEFQRPSGLAWLNGKLYVADAINNRILTFNGEGEYLGRFGKNLDLRFPYDIAAGSDGAIYIVEYGTGRVTRVSLEGEILGRRGQTGSGENELSTPWGLAVDSKMRIIVADTGNRRLVEYKQ